MARLRTTDRVRAKSEPSAAPPSLPMLLNSSKMRFTGTGQRMSGVLSANRVSLMNRKEKNRELRKAMVASWSLSTTKVAHFLFPGAVRSISLWRRMWATASFCSTCSRVPNPSTMPDRTVSLAWENSR